MILTPEILSGDESFVSTKLAVSLTKLFQFLVSRTPEQLDTQWYGGMVVPSNKRVVPDEMTYIYLVIIHYFPFFLALVRLEPTFHDWKQLIRKARKIISTLTSLIN